MGVKGKAKFPSVIEASLKANPQIQDLRTFRQDSASILEAMLAEFDEDSILEALKNQGFKARAYKTNLGHLRKLACERRPKRLAG